MFADSLDSPDYMCRGSDDLPDPVEDYEQSMPLVAGGSFKVRKGLRFREETDFWLVHIVGAWITKVSPEVAKFLIEHERADEVFTVNVFPEEKEKLADLLTKKIVEKVTE